MCPESKIHFSVTFDVEAKALSFTTGLPTNGQQIEDSDKRNLTVFQNFSDVSMIVPRRQIHKTRIKQLRIKEMPSLQMPSTKGQRMG
jgi:hypothetical protein